MNNIIIVELYLFEKSCQELGGFTYIVQKSGGLVSERICNLFHIQRAIQ
jgi:hypothetical protein